MWRQARAEGSPTSNQVNETVQFLFRKREKEKEHGLPTSSIRLGKDKTGLRDEVAVEAGRTV